MKLLLILSLHLACAELVPSAIAPSAGTNLSIRGAGSSKGDGSGNGWESGSGEDTGSEPADSGDPERALQEKLRPYADAGLELYWKWQRAIESHHSDAPLIDILDTKVYPAPGTAGATQASISDYIQEGLKQDGIDDLSGLTRIDSQWPKSKKPFIMAEFVAYADIHQGVFIARTAQFGDEGKTTLKGGYDLSQIAWSMWTSYVEKQAVPGRATPDYSALRLFYIANLDQVTAKVLGYLLRAEAGNHHRYEKQLTPDNEQKFSNQFWAVLGTPGGATVIKLLTDNVHAMKHKGIEKLRVVRRKVPHGEWAIRYDLWATFTPAT